MIFLQSNSKLPIDINLHEIIMIKQLEDEVIYDYAPNSLIFAAICTYRVLSDADWEALGVHVHRRPRVKIKLKNKNTYLVYGSIAELMTKGEN